MVSTTHRSVSTIMTFIEQLKSLLLEIMNEPVHRICPGNSMWFGYEDRLRQGLSIDQAKNEEADHLMSIFKSDQFMFCEALRECYKKITSPALKDSFLKVTETAKRELRGMAMPLSFSPQSTWLIIFESLLGPIVLEYPHFYAVGSDITVSKRSGSDSRVIAAFQKQWSIQDAKMFVDQMTKAITLAEKVEQDEITRATTTYCPPEKFSVGQILVGDIRL